MSERAEGTENGMKNAAVRAYLSRYVVPFYYEYGDYETLRDHFLELPEESYHSSKLAGKGKWIRAGFWENYRSGKDSLPEMDLYSYLPSVFTEAEGDSHTPNPGVSLVYKTDGKILNLEYVNTDKTMGFNLTELGILLFRNGTGFVWYETGFAQKEITITEYEAFQHEFKELARVYKGGAEAESGKPPKKMMRRKTGKDSYESFRMGEWLSKILFSGELRIRFWAERKTEMEGKAAVIPDKALLFQYVFCDGPESVGDHDPAFRIANGYDDKYSIPEDIGKSMYRPFGNSCFYVSKAGMACVATNTNTNEEFYKHQFAARFKRDYFFIFLLLSYQSFSCAHYAKLLAKLPADLAVYREDTEQENKLESLNGEITLFLVKSVFGSVSNMHHQNEVYRYGKTALHIEEDLQSLTIGLSALEELEKERRDRKVNTALAFFGFIIVVSALIDGLNLFDFISGPGMGMWHWIVFAVILLICGGFGVYLFRATRKKKDDKKRHVN
ncbi:MAG: DUF308 domain-containing protein [Lachnospiraceae bacterium]|nr:DUF308 domain-containing protein [Lachnospiraceae bacterium]